MNHFFNNIEINNFKSIKHLKTDCKRINVFIGKPNVGKSNILEAISVLGAHYCRNSEKFLSEFIRYEEISNLFYDDDILHNVEVITDKVQAVLRFHSNNINLADLAIGNGEWIETIVNSNSSINDNYSEFSQFSNLKNKANETQNFNPHYVAMHTNGKTSRGQLDMLLSTSNPVKKYNFIQPQSFSNKFPYSLLPPHGDNLFTIVDHNKELRKEIVEIFSEYGLQFVAYKKENKFEIEKSIDGYVSKFHYSSIADTFQRLIFYYAAIDSNQDSILILEEPEVHSFPPYTKELSERIITSKENQFFITTHSPYLLQNLVSNLGSDELNLFITYFENYQTKIKKLTDEDLRNVSDFSIDLFYNLNQFVHNA